LFRLALLGFSIAFGLIASTAVADSASAPVGRWMTANQQAVIQVSHCGPDICGQIVGLAQADQMPTDWRGHPQCGLTIFQTAPSAGPSGSTVWQGKILDPRNGNIYNAQIAVDGARHLELHGYIGLPIFGQTQTWTPYSGRTMANCHLAAAPAGQSEG
jgi:uncharacterized protein (DUF2147 family)